MPVLIEFLGVEMRGEVSPIGSGAGYMMEGRGVVIRTVVWRVDVIDGRSTAVRRPRGRRDHA